MLSKLLTLMAGWVLVVSLLFSPGMLPAERPSHLYLNLIPLCFGCSMISMKGVGVATWKRSGVKEMWINCSGSGVQNHSIWVLKRRLSTLLYLNLCINAKITQYQCQYLPIPVVTHEQPALTISTDLYRMLIIYWKQHFTWVE